MKYVYPAIFTKEDGGYSIRFPDIESCYTSAADLVEGVDMARDVLCFMLYDLEERKAAIPAPSDVSTLRCAKNEFVTLVACDTLEYRKFYDSRAVKKTLSIPAWLNTMAESAGINFSATLQSALKEALELH